MQQFLARFALVGAMAGCWLTGSCTADVHDNTLAVQNPSLDFTTSVDVQHVTAGEALPVHMSAPSYYLVAPDAAPPPEHVADAAYFEIFLDDVRSAPLVITASTSVSVKVPEQTSAGSHALKCRLMKHDGTPTDIETDIAITVVVSVTGAGTGGSTSTGGSTGTGGRSGTGGMMSTGGTGGIGTYAT